MATKFEKITNDVYVYEAMCNCYLLIGESHALLVDTGGGLKNIEKVVKQVTDKPLIVVNTHAHFDHFGGNHYFPTVFVHEADREVASLHNNTIFRKYFLSRMPFLAKLLIGKKLSKEVPLKYTYINGMEPINLGDRVVKWIHTPGHTPGSCCLFDEKEGYLFGGDTLVPNGVLLNLDYSQSPETFKDSMLKLKGIQHQIKYVFPGHHAHKTDASLIDDYIDVCEKSLSQEGTIIDGKVSMAKVFANEKVQLVCKIEY